MRMNEIGYGSEAGGQVPVDGYGSGGFRVSGAWHAGAVLAGPDGVSALSAPLSAEALGPVLALAGRVDVLLIGQGPEIAYFPADLRALLERAGMGVEAMSTPSACRTYNVLLAEARRVAAVLLPV